MKHVYLLMLIALLLVIPAGCSDRSSQEQRLSAVDEAQLAVQAKAGDAEAAKKLDQIQKGRAAMPQNELGFAPDIRDGWDWPAKEVAALIKRAKAGDVEAADRLHQYYSVHEDEVNMAYWEDWLFKRGDLGAIEMRVHRLYSASERRSSDDPQKLVELREVERLERLVTAERGKTPFLDKIKSEITVLEGAQ